ncbi:MAG: hypothetical protein K0R62_7326 [Nonomuraea muscovyensis]|nr:hypothetical protein [Nonomuraea muscovyensis]
MVRFPLVATLDLLTCDFTVTSDFRQSDRPDSA